LCNAKVLSQEDSKFVDCVLQGDKFKHHNLAIYVVNFLRKISTHYFNNPKQDPMIESPKNKTKFNLCNLHYKWQFWIVHPKGLLFTPKEEKEKKGKERNKMQLIL
jgi:hypothetical protein